MAIISSILPSSAALMKTTSIVPLLKWMGGKRQLLPKIHEHLPKNINELRYYEPFLGGGAVLFDLQPKRAVISDLNAELINVYKVIKTNPEELIDELYKHPFDKEYFYKLRAVDRTGELKNWNDIQKAARIIYLNKTCYNGMYRVNKAGQFNVPFGRYKNPTIVNEPAIRAISSFFNSNDISIKNDDYKRVLSRIKGPAFVYLDPPYHPVSPTAAFTEYIQGGWDANHQVELKEYCDKLTANGIKFLLSNSCTDFVQELYADYNISIVHATRLMNSQVSGRGHVDEVLVQNF